VSFSNRLENLEKRLEYLETSLYKIEKRVKILEALSLTYKQVSGLPNHLLTTLITIYKLGPTTASQVADETKKERAVESAYLNQLATMGYLRKERKGKKVHFEINYDSKLTKDLLKFLKIQRK
jgi:DNA-binding transcriptional ArsR family regulator